MDRRPRVVGPGDLLIGIAMDTWRPSVTVAQARRTCSGVIRLSVPMTSSSPHRPQFFTDS